MNIHKHFYTTGVHHLKYNNMYQLPRLSQLTELAVYITRYVIVAIAHAADN